MVYIVSMIIATIFYIISVNNPENYTTTVTCGEETYIFNHSVSEDKRQELCPTSYKRFIYPEINITVINR